MSTRPPPPASRPPPYSMVSRVYRTNFRPVVIITALLAAGWTLVMGIGSFQDINVDKNQKETKFATLDIVLGALYMGACAIALFGVIAAVMDKLLWARIYKFASIVAALLIIASGFMRTVTHFVYKNDLINECTEIVQGHDLTYRFGIWGPVIHETLNEAEANDVCKNGWSHDSFTEIVSLLVEIVLMFFFVSIAFTYYRQLLDPASFRAPAPTKDTYGQSPVGGSGSTFPEHYNPPYLGYDAPAPTYAPPPGPPPEFGKAPVYDPAGAPKGYLDGKDDDPFADFESVHRDGKPGESREALV